MTDKDSQNDYQKVTIRVLPDMKEEVTEYRKNNIDIVSDAGAVRRLIALGLKTVKKETKNEELE